jgi:predicted ester cyclase
MENNNRLEENKAVTRKIVDIFNIGDVSDVASVFSPHYVDHQADTQRAPGVDIDGPEEFRQVVTGARKALPNLTVTIEDLIAESDTVAARLQWHSIDSTGKKIKRETIEILRFSNGQVVEHWGAESWSSENTSDS